MNDLNQALSLVPLLLKLGQAVIEAVHSGQTGKTVGEILDDMPLDAEELARLRALARAAFGA